MEGAAAVGAGGAGETLERTRRKSVYCVAKRKTNLQERDAS